VYPKKLSPIPIVSAVVELKFDIKLLPDIIFGKIYAKLDKDFPKITPLPILQMPSALREQTEDLKFHPHYELSNNEDVFRVLIGPRVLSIVFNKTNKEYPGWDSYLKIKIEDVFKKVFEANVIENVIRLGIRYTDFFEKTNIFEHINLSIADNDNKKIIDDNMQFTRRISDDIFYHQIMVSNNAEIMFSTKPSMGSIIDIDTYIDKLDKDFNSNYMCLIQKAHKLNKHQFFNIIDKEYIDEKFNPKY
jgi:uncharacterized protein (TIGR04255 family)